MKKSFETFEGDDFKYKISFKINLSQIEALL